MGNVSLSARQTALPKDSVVNVSQIITVGKNLLSTPVGKLSRTQLQLVHSGIAIILGR